MQLVGAGGQRVGIRLFDASSTITTGGTPQLIVANAYQRSSFIFENISDTNMYLEFGAGRAAATISSGGVASVAVTNAGFGYSKAPSISFLGGGNTGNNQNNPTFKSATLPDYAAPANPAQAHCVMTGSAPNMTISSIVVDNPGSGYAVAPYVLLTNDPNDPAGCAAPSTTSGILIVPNGSYTNNGVTCTTDSIGVYCASSSKNYTFKWTV